MNRPLLFGGLAATFLLIAVLASGFGREPHHLRSPLVGREAPPFALPRVDGKGAISLQSLRGKPTVLNFWATWCQPCMQEHHVLQEGALRAGSRFQFVSVVYEDEPEKITRFLASSGSTYPALVDHEGRTAIAYGVYGVPETFFIDAKGQIIAKYPGPLSPRLLDEYLAQLEQEGAK